MSAYFKSKTGVDLETAPQPDRYDFSDLIAMAHDRNDHLEREIADLEDEIRGIKQSINDFLGAYEHGRKIDLDQAIKELRGIVDA